MWLRALLLLSNSRNSALTMAITQAELTQAEHKGDFARSAPSCRIVFWNVKNKDLTSAVCSLANSAMADVVVLNENRVPSTDMLCALREDVSSDFYIPKLIENRFHCFCRNPGLDLSEVHAGLRTSVRKFKLGKHVTLLALVHGPDLRNYDSAERDSFAQRLAGEMRFVMEEKKIDKLILLGDFNMNPYDRGMNLAAGLNAMMTRSCVARGSRQHQYVGSGDTPSFDHSIVPQCGDSDRRRRVFIDEQEGPSEHQEFLRPYFPIIVTFGADHE